jgi:hypothetical protein
MRKVLAIVLWAWIPFSWQPLRGQAPSVGVESSHKPKQQSNFTANQPPNDQRGTKESPFVVETHERPKTETEAKADKEKADGKDFIDRWTFYLAGANTIFTGLLMVAGIGGVALALRTVSAIEDQGKIMKRQADLMDLQLTPWATIQNWQTHLGPVSSDPQVLTVTFEAINESGFPLTTVGTLNFFGQLPQGAQLVIPAMTLLPKRPVNVRVNLYLSGTQALEYAKGRLLISVHGKVCYIGVSTVPRSIMDIHGNLACGLNKKTELESETITLTAVQLTPEQQSKAN